jgi:uncharacterized protein (DUF433 family)
MSTVVYVMTALFPHARLAIIRDRLPRTVLFVVDPIGAKRYSCNMDITRLITVEPGKRGGQPCIRGMRITVRDVLEYLAGGMTVEEVLRDFPELTVDDIRACLTYADSQPPRSAA